MSTSSSTEELAKINDGSCDGEDSTDGATPTQIVKPEPTKSAKPHPQQQHQKDFTQSYPPMAGTYSSSQGSHIAPPPLGYSNVPDQSSSYAPPTSSAHQHHAFSLSQPGPSQTLPSQSSLSNSQGSHSQGHTYYPAPHQNQVAMDVAGRDGGGAGGGAGGSKAGSFSSYPRQKIVYENVPPPISYDGNPRHAPHMPHPHPAQHNKYVNQGGVANQVPSAGFKQGVSVDPRDRTHDKRDRPHDGRGGAGGPMDYPPPSVPRPPYSSGAGPRRKPINPASISVSYDAAGSGDIATLVSVLTTPTQYYSHTHLPVMTSRYLIWNLFHLFIFFCIC